VLVSIARASIYSEFFLGLLARSLTSGQLRQPAADSRISLVSRADVARCLAPLVALPRAILPAAAAASARNLSAASRGSAAPFSLGMDMPICSSLSFLLGN
jgi:uncharacterized protein YbjT (DUF2867 family)